MKHYDIVVIGAGPGGYTAAIRAAQAKKKVAIIEKNELGGVCLNWGCIPSKNLIHQAEAFGSLTEMETIGIKVDRSGLDYKKVHGKSRGVVDALTGGIAHLLKKNAVDKIEGCAVISGKKQITVNGNQNISADNIIIATGSRPMQIAGFECDEQTILSSTGILQLTELPESLIILGGGAIGCEFAYVMNNFGVKVTLVEAMEQLLPTEDNDICVALTSSFKHAGIEVLTQTRALSVETTDNQVLTRLSEGTTQREITSEKALVVFGRTPNTENLGLSEQGVTLDKRGYVVTHDYGQTDVPGIYAIGDITASPALAHVAIKEGELAVNAICGHQSRSKKIDKDLIPSAIYCEPQVASFGLREQVAKANNIAVKKSVFNYSGAGKTIAIGKSSGFIKVLCAAQTDEILGVHIIGYNATELIHELLLAKSAELLPETIAEIIHAHPTISEVIPEVISGINGKPVHG